MMTAQEYRDRSAAMARAADGSSSYGAILEFDALALAWLNLAAVADWQTAMLDALAQCEDGA